MQKCSPSPLSETCDFNKSMEATVAVDHNSKKEAEQGTTAQLISDNSVDGGYQLSSDVP